MAALVFICDSVFASKQTSSRITAPSLFREMHDGVQVAAVVLLMESLMVSTEKNCSERMDTPSTKEFLVRNGWFFARGDIETEEMRENKEK